MGEKINNTFVFFVNIGLVASNGGGAWKVLDAISDISSYARYKFGKVVVSDQLIVGAYWNCLVSDDKGQTTIDPNHFMMTFRAFFDAGRQSVTLGDLIISSNKAQKFGYACVAGSAIYGGVIIGLFAIHGSRKLIRKYRAKYMTGNDS